MSDEITFANGQQIFGCDRWDAGFRAGVEKCEAKVREALRGHPQSELWGEHGLLAATMRSNDGYRKRIQKALKILEETE
jgi:hypothetical protein